MNKNLKALVRHSSASLLCAAAALCVAAHPDGGRPDRPFPAADAPTQKFTNSVSITVEGRFRLVRANGIPDHETGQFPGRYNPNRISPQSYTFLIPLKPEIASKPTPVGMSPFGVGLNGVVFDPAAAEWWNGDPSSGWQKEPMVMQGRLGADQNNGHVQPHGAYHYHGVPTGLVEKSTDGKVKMALVGWAADGFPIYGPWCYTDAKNARSILKNMKSSYKIRKGTRPNGPGGSYDGLYVADYEFIEGAGDLDECNGRFGVTPEFPKGTYYYVLTEEFPFIPRLFKGTPDRTFLRSPPPGGGPGRRGPRGFGPPEHEFGPPPHAQRDDSDTFTGSPR